MKNKLGIIAVILVLLIVGTGVVVYNSIFSSDPTVEIEEQDEDLVENIPPVDASVIVEVSRSSKEPNTVIMKASGLAGKMVSVGYELTYDSEGLGKGVTSGSSPIDTTGKDNFERDVYLGTCSRNVCKPDVGVTKVSVVLEFTDKDGKKSQFTKDYDL